jgi:hypothetical protein
MKFIIVASAIAVIGMPGFSLACQNDAPVTRAKVRQELIQLEEAGYNPSASTLHYPQEIQAAQARVAAKHDSAYGSPPCSNSEAGGRSNTR